MIEADLQAVRASQAAIISAQEKILRRLDELEALFAPGLPVDEFARRARISKSTAWRKIHAGEIPVVRPAGKTLVPLSVLRGVDEDRVNELVAQARTR